MSSTDAGLQAWTAMLSAHNTAMRAIDAEIGRAGGIALTWYDVLLELSHGEDGRLRMQDLADRVVLSRTRVSRLVDEMAGAGLVTKARCDTDRRVIWATITAAGREALAATGPIYLRGIEAHFGSYLTEDEKRVVATALFRVGRGIHQIASRPPADFPR